MNKSSSNTVTIELLAKYYAGETNAAESNQVNQWVKDSPENEVQFIRAKIIWQDTGILRPESLDQLEFDIEFALNKVKSNKQVGTKRSYVWQIAASVALLIGLGWIVQTFVFTEVMFVEVTANEQIEEVQLHDGSKITLNKQTTLDYPEAFDQETRIVRLSGEAFFEVTHQPERPFIVELGDASVKVLGTSFNIDSRPNTDTAFVWVETGKVLFFTDSREVILTAGSKGYWVKSRNELEVMAQKSVTGLDQFWRTNTLVFNGQKLPEVLHALSQAYHVQFELKNEVLRDCSLAVTFRDESLDSILEIIRLTLNLEVSEENGILKIDGNGCQ